MRLGHVVATLAMASFYGLADPVMGTSLLSGAVTVAAGSGHTCAIVAGGQVLCWGRNDEGQLGTGTTTDWASPLPVVGLAGGGMAVVAGWAHTCVLTDAGGVKCWGRNSSGQLGNGTTASSTVPVDVAGLATGVSSIAAGTDHTCAQTAAGMRCWGNNNAGQLGTITTTDSSVPVAVYGSLGSDPDEVRSIIAGDSHTCAITTYQRLFCWGANHRGQLARGNTLNDPYPNYVLRHAGGPLLGVKDATARGSHSCAVYNEGGPNDQFACWGDNWNGQTGAPLSTQYMTLVGNYGTAPVVAASTGRSHTCLVRPSGSVNCVGANGAGQLGIGSTAATSGWKTVTGLSSGASSVTSGNSHSCAVTTSGGIKCWGNNSHGQSGNGRAGGVSAQPVDVLAPFCAGFVDVHPASAFCRNINWLKNRQITLGCTSDAYCPAAGVSRLAMAVFMNRLGGALSPKVVAVSQAFGPVDLDATPLVCQSSSVALAGVPSTIVRASLFSGTAAGDVDLTVSPVFTMDNGATWQNWVSGRFVTIPAGHWGNSDVVDAAVLTDASSVRFAMRLNRRGAPDTSDISEGSCSMLIRIENANGSTAPFDVD